MRPRWAELDLGGAERVWRDSRNRFGSQVVGPHFEQICREWALTAELYGEPVGEVGTGVVTDPDSRSQIEIDVAVLSPAWPGEPRRVLSLGEAKWDKVMGPRHLARLARARDLLADRGFDTSSASLACYSGAGFDSGLRAAATDENVMLVDAAGLYNRTGPVSRSG
jgi:hypothetical protein